MLTSSILEFEGKRRLLADLIREECFHGRSDICELSLEDRWKGGKKKLSG